MGSSFSGGDAAAAWSRPPSTPFWTTAAAICGSPPATASRAATALALGCRAAGCSHWIEFGAADGLRSRETATNSHPSAWRSRDGHLWFATPKGLVEVDPAHFPVNTVPPPVALERFAVDDVDQALRAAGSFVADSSRACAFPVRLRGTELYRAAEGALPLYAGGLRPRLDRGRRAPHRLLHEYSAGAATPSACRRPTTTGFGTPRARRWPLSCGRTSIRPSGSMRCCWRLAVGLVVLLLRLRLRRAESEFRAVLGERNRIAREIHDTLAQGYVGISVQLEVLAELLRHEQDGGRGQASGPDPRLRARGAGRRAAIDLGAALAGLGRDHAAGAPAPHGRGRRRPRIGGQLQHLRRLPALAAGDGARNSARGPGGHP